MPKRYTVLLVDDHEVFREGLRALLAGYSDISVVGDAADGPASIEKARALKPDLILMDVSLPTGDGIQATAQIKLALPETKVLILTTAADDPELVYKAIRAGASGYLAKTTGIDELVKSIRSAARGEVVVASGALNSLFSYLGHQSAVEVCPAETPGTLSAREEEVLAHIAEGLSNRQIADRLSITENTVNSHVRSILGKLNLENRVQAAAHAVRTKRSEANKQTRSSTHLPRQ